MGEPVAMKQVSIYSALGLAETASDREVSHALRQMLRENYKKARDNFGVLEDSLRFYNQASQILNDKNRRKLYDAEWSLSNASEEQRINFVLRQAVEGNLAPPLAEGGLPDLDETAAVRMVNSLEEIPKPVSNLELVPADAGLGFQTPPLRLGATSPPATASQATTSQVKSQPKSLPGLTKAPGETTAKSLPETGSGTKSIPAPPKVQHYHPILTENIGYSRSLIFQGLGAGLTALLIGALLYVTWEHTIKSFEVAQSWIWGIGLLLAILFYSTGWRQGQRRREKNFELSSRPDEEAIKGWRRKQTVFLGSNFLAEDPSWVFQLRLTELERGRIGRTSYSHLWRRALARLFDYALWGWLLFFPLYELARLGLVPQMLFQGLSNPLAAPILITLTWIPVEALLMAAVGTTLGKWLFGVYIQFRVSTPYAPRGGGDCWHYALQRAFRVWWQGVAAGFAPLAPMAAARARTAAERFDETDWDEEYDVLVTHTPMSIIPGLVGGFGLALLLFMYVAAWQRPLFVMGEEAVAWGIQQIERQDAATVTAPAAMPRQAVSPTDGETGSGERTDSAPSLIDPETVEGLRKLEEFREAIVRVREESLLLLDKKDWRRAYESCQRWARLEVTNPAPMRCQGTALQAMGRHQEAINAFRSAKVYAPEDRSLDDAITRSQDEVFKELNR
ncbi:MAG: RDD family protein [Burkholderiales bacterium]|jgi:tetratricopeptide (TPR) repeat protein|nr:RDD family protein [Burkholderiales bacterium]